MRVDVQSLPVYQHLVVGAVGRFAQLDTLEERSVEVKEGLDEEGSVGVDDSQAADVGAMELMSPLELICSEGIIASLEKQLLQVLSMLGDEGHSVCWPREHCSARELQRRQVRV